jgi:hypothetical protein
MSTSDQPVSAWISVHGAYSGLQPVIDLLWNKITRPLNVGLLGAYWSVQKILTVVDHVELNQLGDTKSAACGRHAAISDSCMPCVAVVVIDSCDGLIAQVCIGLHCLDDGLVAT